MAQYIIDIPDGVPVGDGFVPLDMCRPSWYWEAYEKGKADAENEVWEFAWEVLQLDLPLFREIFGYDTDKMDYKDYKYKYEAWKKEKDRICVGDEVELFDGVKGCVYIVGEEMLEGAYLNCDGLVSFCWKKEDCRKTGRHYDEIAELLKKVRDEYD